MTAPVTVTRAAERIAQIVSNDPENNMLRVSVEGGGCSGFEYSFDLVSNAEPEDILIERAGARVLVDSLSLSYLAGLGDRLHRRSDDRVVQDQEPKRNCFLWLRHELLGLKPIDYGRTLANGNRMTLDTIRSDFAFLDDWEDRYRYVIELGRGLPPLPEAYRTDGYKVRGCASQVWLATETERRADGTAMLRFQGDSDAHIVRGLIAILFAIYSGKTADDVLGADAQAIFTELGLKEHLTPQRSNGFAAMVERIRSDARAMAAPRPEPIVMPYHEGWSCRNHEG